MEIDTEAPKDREEFQRRGESRVESTIPASIY